MVITNTVDHMFIVDMTIKIFNQCKKRKKIRLIDKDVYISEQKCNLNILEKISYNNRIKKKCNSTYIYYINTEAIKLKKIKSHW